MKTNFEYTGGVDVFVSAYIDCALWSSIDDSGNPLDDNYSASDLAPEALKRMAADCAAFVVSYGTLLADWNASQAGHDFWLTRNHHGAGFWDRGRAANGDALTDAAHACGEVYLYAGDDGHIYTDGFVAGIPPGGVTC